MYQFIEKLAPEIGKFFVTAKTNDVFFDIGILIIISTMFAFIAKKLKQPLIPAYIITGLLAGPIYGLVTNKGLITTLSEIGIAFLLFTVGLELDLKKLKDVAVVAGIGGAIRSILMFTLGFIIAMVMGFVKKDALYIGIIIAFSSTMVVIKLLSDKREIDTLHGRIIIGILLLEDLLAILALSILTSLNGNSVTTIIPALIKGVLLILITFASTRIIFPALFKVAAKSQELLFLSSISVCFLFSIIAYYLNFAISIGAFLAGLTLANLPYNIMIIGKVKPLRDFFSTIFFVSLGMELVLSDIRIILIPLIILLALTLIIKPIITMFLCAFFGYKNRVSFLTSISLAQVSEFSLILVAQGLVLGHISRDIFTLVILVTLVTMTLTSYFIKFDNEIYLKLKGSLKIFDGLTGRNKELEYLPAKKKIDIILCGHDRVGYSIGRTIETMDKNLLVVDYNPEIIKSLIKDKVSCIYGDIGDMEILERLPFNEVEMVVSTVPSSRVNKLLIQKIRQVNKNAVIYVTTTAIDKALDLYAQGADYVILPHFLGGDHVSSLIKKIGKNTKKIANNKQRHIEELKHRQSIGHEHHEQNQHEE